MAQAAQLAVREETVAIMARARMRSEVDTFPDISCSYNDISCSLVNA